MASKEKLNDVTSETTTDAKDKKRVKPNLQLEKKQDNNKQRMNSKKGPTKTAQYLQIDYDDLELYDRIGRGAYGSVYHALWKSRDKIVAVKKLLQLENEVRFLLYIFF